VQVAGSINFQSDLSPAALDDSSEKRYLWYNDNGERRPAPMQAALAPYLGNRNVRLDSGDNMAKDLAQGIVLKIFSCPAQREPQPAVMIGSYENNNWTGPLVQSSYGYNEGLMGFEGPTPNGPSPRLRGNLGKAQPSSQILFMTDAVPRSGGGPLYIAWFPAPEGGGTLADCYHSTNGNGAGMASEFDVFRHPRFAINVVFCDGHTQTLTINDRDLEHAMLLPK
jgi:prepilin-type processing-associated H-X9-DG protein